MADITYAIDSLSGGPSQDSGGSKYDDLFAAAADKYKIDPDMLRNVARVESSLNPHATSTDPKTGKPIAHGLMQLTMPTAQALGVKDPYDPAQAIDGAAKLLRQNLDASNGDQTKALMMYHGGTDASQWGPKTQAYPGKVLGTSASSPTQDSGDSITSAIDRMAGGAGHQIEYIDDSNNPNAKPGPGLRVDVSGVSGGQEPGQPKPVDGMSNTDLAIAGAKKSVVDLGRGVSQLVGGPAAYLENKLTGTKVGDAINQLGAALGMPSAAQANINNQQAIDNAKVEDAPLMKTVPGMLGYAGGSLASTLIPAGVMAKGAQAAKLPGVANALEQLINPSTYKAAAAGGAALSALSPVATGDSRLSNMELGAAGGMAGNLLANSIGRIAQPVANAGSGAADLLKSAGVPLDAAQQSGSPFLSRVKGSLSDNPFTVGGQVELAGKQKAAYNSAVLKTIGEDAKAATPDVMSTAKTRIGNVFDDVAERNPVAYDKPLETALTAIGHDANSQLQPGQLSVIQKQMDNILDKATTNGGAIDGAAYQNIKRGLDRLSGGSDSDIGHFARQMRSALDDALERSAKGNEGDYAALIKARQQWRNMRLIEGAIDKEGTGDISPSRLANILGQKSNRSQSVYGNGPQDLIGLAQAGKQIIPEKLPQSGTVPRAMMQLLTQGGIGGAAGYLSSGGDPAEAAKYAAGAVAVPKLLQILMNNPGVANYLANGIEPGLARSAISAPATNPLLSPFVRNAPRAALQARSVPKP